MKDPHFFQAVTKGELHELQQELRGAHKETKKNAIKKTIAAMTVGKDVSCLFADVIKCMQTNNMELKKLVYLYIINYAKAHPELAILAVNTFKKDSLDPNPLIRQAYSPSPPAAAAADLAAAAAAVLAAPVYALCMRVSPQRCACDCLLRALALRTMGYIRLEAIAEYLAEPLRRCCADVDPYVRKTAAICIAKLYDIRADMVEAEQLVLSLKKMLEDSNPVVVANAVAALGEISEASSTNLIKQFFG
ncbi:hypothetical protein EAH_00023600 [Eimeria acervulina]|uniref:Uncharacterized protein n=1 Tax=Eimeria acervulina TaxID=5801 RepID=U6GDC3_EIMAC|nr:hypothetical protein EAH_00023600 [Eimeria acervulina]CDI77353.1 hypothetical protein EAH_00023600 [Eimeria acervulina]